MSTQHFWLADGAAAGLTLGPAYCSVDCATCSEAACPELGAIQCPAGNVGVAVVSSAFTWDGSYVANGSCAAVSGPTGPVSRSVACVRQQFAAPGTYTARFCATPGTLENSPDGGAALCTPSGAQVCTEVGFVYPAVQQIAITLPSP
jgi:hypothetical protein